MITGVEVPKDFVFVHIPKVAGHTIGVSLHKPVRSHTVARLLRAQSQPEAWEAAFKFCFVRNPWDHVVSWYNYHFNRHRASMYNCTFEAWVKDGLKTHWKKDWCGEEVANDPLNQLLYFQDLAGKDIVDFIGAYENLEDDLAYISGVLGRDGITIPHLNKCDHKHYREFYTDETENIVRKRYACIIERFGYEF
ncbi:MAG: sulfotransferase family protein [Hydrogenophaga sp.]|uniref:sulfotransferase family 2 domain-containing protein n=1 Tax=Hydrogenophaga sp. TaxID=1904254 RepID=UPI00260C1FC1|nr:sulfotransferase family 2 domain-containing protein [Hydrogenophaga sp.]MCV0439745.1 sulfotransferase family protein [Hydrogenophaga sp.]